MTTSAIKWRCQVQLDLMGRTVDETTRLVISTFTASRWRFQESRQFALGRRDGRQDDGAFIPHSTDDTGIGIDGRRRTANWNYQSSSFIRDFLLIARFFKIKDRLVNLSHNSIKVFSKRRVITNSIHFSFYKVHAERYNNNNNKVNSRRLLWPETDGNFLKLSFHSFQNWILQQSTVIRYASQNFYLIEMLAENQLVLFYFLPHLKEMWLKACSVLILSVNDGKCVENWMDAGPAQRNRYNPSEYPHSQHSNFRERIQSPVFNQCSAVEQGSVQSLFSAIPV